MKIKLKDFRVKPDEKVELKEWPTIGKPFYKSKAQYQQTLGEHVQNLSVQHQRLLPQVAETKTPRPMDVAGEFLL